MMRLFIIAFVLATSTAAIAQLLTTGYGPGSFGGGAILTNCGTGVLDFSTGCAPMLSGV